MAEREPCNHLLGVIYAEDGIEHVYSDDPERARWLTCCDNGGYRYCPLCGEQLEPKMEIVS